MFSVSDDDYSSSSYYSLSNKKCSKCNKIITNRQHHIQQHNDNKKAERKNHCAVSRFTRVFKCFSAISHCRRRYQKNIIIEDICTCVNAEKPSKSSDSFTFIEEQPEQPWIVPSDYHKNVLSNSPDSRNQWIFRTGWTPQPDPLALIHSGWCKNCGSCVKKDLDQCSFCGIQPLITTRHGLGEIEEKN